MRAFVIFRDRVTYAKQCVEALYEAGVEEVIVLNQGSTYKPALDWLFLDPDITVEHTANLHPQNLWNTDLIKYHIGPYQRYLVTDCDVIPDPSCPDDWLEHLTQLLDKYPSRFKAGLGLRTSDLPGHYAHRIEVQRWELQHWENRIASGVFGAAVDTTLAVYQPLNIQPNFCLGPAIRTDFPYMANHLPWYEDSSNPSEEQLYYEAHMNRDYSHWINPERYT